MDRRAEALGIPAGGRLRAPLLGDDLQTPGGQRAAVGGQVETLSHHQRVGVAGVEGLQRGAQRWPVVGGTAPLTPATPISPASSQPRSAMADRVASIGDRSPRSFAHTPVFTRWERIGTWWAVRSATDADWCWYVGADTLEGAVRRALHATAPVATTVGIARSQLRHDLLVAVVDATAPRRPTTRLAVQDLGGPNGPGGRWGCLLAGDVDNADQLCA